MTKQEFLPDNCSDRYVYVITTIQLINDLFLYSFYTIIATKKDTVMQQLETPPIVPTISDLRKRLIDKLNSSNSITAKSILVSSFIEMSRLFVLYHNCMRSFRLDDNGPYLYPCNITENFNDRESYEVFSLFQRNYSEGMTHQLYKLNM